MPRINLLPWREQLREERKQEFFRILIGCSVLVASVMLSVHIIIGRWIDAQDERNKYLTGQVKLLEQQIAEIESLKELKENLIARMNVIQELQASRTIIVHLFDDLARMTPDGVYLTNVDMAGRLVTLQGKAQSNAEVSALMRNIEQSTWFSSAMLSEVVQEDKDSEKANFTLRMMLIDPTQSAMGMML